MIVDSLEFHVKRSGNSASKSVDKLGRSVKNLHKGLGGLAHTVGRLAKMMVLRQAIRSLMKALGEGLKSAYQFNSIMGGEMSAALDRLKSAAVQTTGALGSAFGELIANVAPILIQLLNLIARVADAFAQLMAVLGGRSKYTKAVQSSEKWADATSKGAKAAKEWKNQLMGFDEINRLEDQSDNGSGSGQSPYDGAFELADATNEWAKQLRQITLDWWSKLNLEPITQAWQRLTAAVGDFVAIVDKALYWAYVNVLLPVAGWTIEQGAPAMVNLLASAFEFLNVVLQKLQPVFLYLYNNIVKPFGQWLGNAFIKAVNYATEAFEGLTKKLTAAKTFSEFLKSLNGKEALLLGIASAIGVIVAKALLFKTVTTVMNTATAAFTLLTNPITLVAAAVAGLVTIGIALYKNWDDIKKQVGELKKKFEEMIKPLKDGIKAFGDIVAEHCPHVIELINLIINLFQRAKEAVLQLNELAKARAIENERTGALYSTTPEDYSYVTGHAAGGFVDSGELFMARENGLPEMVGRIGNRTAVANNDQIVEAISNGVFSAVVSAMGSSGGNNTPVNIYLDGSLIAKSTTKYQRQFARAGTM